MELKMIKKSDGNGIVAGQILSYTTYSTSTAFF